MLLFICPLHSPFGQDLEIWRQAIRLFVLHRTSQSNFRIYRKSLKIFKTQFLALGNFSQPTNSKYYSPIEELRSPISFVQLEHYHLWRSVYQTLLVNWKASAKMPWQDLESLTRATLSLFQPLVVQYWMRKQHWVYWEDWPPSSNYGFIWIVWSIHCRHQFKLRTLQSMWIRLLRFKTRYSPIKIAIPRIHVGHLTQLVNG